MIKSEDKINIAVLQTKLDSIHDRLEKIETNHLPHIYSKLENIEKKMAYYAGGLAVIISLLQIVLSILK